MTPMDVLNEEFLETVKQMNRLKAPGSDGIQVFSTLKAGI